jgi:arylsulfatase A-like enzyme
MAMRWPGKISPGTICATPTITLDIGATFMDLATGSVPKDYDGRSLHGMLTRQEKLDNNRPLHWRFGAKWATRIGDWKIIRATAGDDVQLYNLVQDPTEKNNLAAAYPERLKEMQAIHTEWNKALIAPLWSGNPGQVKEESAKPKVKK